MVYRATAAQLEQSNPLATDTGEDLIPIAALFGWRKVSKEGVLVDIYVDEEKLHAGYETAQLVSNPAHMAKGRGEAWWIVSLEVAEGTLIRVETKVGVYGRGQDTDRTTTSNYIARKEYPIHEVRVKKVGYKNYPLLKGPLQIVSERSLQQLTHQKLDGILKDIEE